MAVTRDEMKAISERPRVPGSRLSDDNVASQFDAAPVDSTGGGVSDTFRRPPFQATANLLPISK
jgi:hypothetical protein